MESPLQKMMNRQVIVKTGDVVYRGQLIEVTEEAVCLMARTGWRQVSMERIVSIALQPECDPAELSAAEDDVAQKNFTKEGNLKD